jgi:phage/plasmid-associated DNA primase
MIGSPSDLPGLAPGGRASPRAWGKFKRHFWGRSLRYQHWAEEAPGVLQWGIDGGMEWRRQGLNPPAVVRAASAEYLCGQDLIEQWIGERLERGGKLLSGDAYESWQHWCAQSGVRHVGSKWKLTGLLVDRGYERDVTGGQRGVIGLSLSPDEHRRILQAREQQRNRRILEEETVRQLGRAAQQIDTTPRWGD